MTTLISIDLHVVFSYWNIKSLQSAPAKIFVTCFINWSAIYWRLTCDICQKKLNSATVVTSIYAPSRQHGSDWSRGLVTLAFDLGHGACGWCGSSSSIRIPSLKFVGLAIRKIWRTMCVSINGPGDPDLWPFDLKLVWESHLRWGTFLQNLGTLGLWVLELFSTYATNGQKDGWMDGRTKATLTAPSIRVGA